MEDNKNYVLAKDIPEDDPINQYSNPQEVWKKGVEWDIPVFRSFKPKKKYMVDTGDKWVHFGEMGYEDYTKHKDEKRRKAFLKRNKKWDDDAGSAGWFSYNFLW